MITTTRPLRPAQRETTDERPAPGISVLIPLHNEQDNVAPLYAELREVLESLGRSYEIIFVDDGSKDETVRRLREVTRDDPQTTIIVLRRNFGQTSAIAAGIDHSTGRVIIPMDGDLQNDPHAIPALLAKLDEPPGYDIVSGWRRDRHDKWLTRRVPSRLANRLIAWITGVRLHDFGCSLKAYRREVLQYVSFSSELHRFLPALAVWHGARITELVVNHRPRVHGQTKYGLRRTIKVLLDLVTVKFLGTYLNKPLYFFGKLAIATLMLAFLVLAVAVAQKFGYMGQPQGLNLNNNVLVPLAALLCFLSVQCILFGILSELLVRIYHQSQGSPTYRVRRIYRHATEQTLEP